MIHFTRIFKPDLVQMTESIPNGWAAPTWLKQWRNVVTISFAAIVIANENNRYYILELKFKLISSSIILFCPAIDLHRSASENDQLPFNSMKFVVSLQERPNHRSHSYEHWNALLAVCGHHINVYENQINFVSLHKSGIIVYFAKARRQPR